MTCWILVKLSLTLFLTTGTSLGKVALQPHLITDSECRNILDHWLRSLTPDLQESTASLEVDWSALDRELKSQSCQYEQLWLELWRWDPREIADGTEEFGTAEYFNQFERCQSLIGFVPHQRKNHSSHVGALKTSFGHVVEEDYVLRLCPCPPKDPEDSGNKCECKFSSSNQFTCSHMLSFKKQAHSTREVFQWCQLNASNKGDATSMLQFKTPTINQCASATLSGTMASCSPVQAYDRVQLLLHEIKEDKNGCNPADHSTDNMIQLDGHLTRRNHTHGDFVITTPNLTEGGVYCILVQIVDHPYCSKQDIFANQQTRTPSVCHQGIQEPFRMPNCTEQPFVQTRVTRHFWLPSIVITALLLVMIILGFALWILCRRSRRHDSDDLNRLKKSPPSTFETGTGSTSVESLEQQTVLFLSFNESLEFMELNLKFISWLEATGVKVIHFDRADLSEEICDNPESFVMDKLHASDTRIIVMNTSMAVRAMKSNLTGDNIDSQTMPLTSVEDNFFDLRLLALRQIQSQFVGNYKKVMVVSYSGFRPSQCDIENITNQRQSLLLPEQLAEIELWLRSVSETEGHPSAPPGVQSGSRKHCQGGLSDSPPISHQSQRLENGRQKLSLLEDEFREAAHKFQDSQSPLAT